MTTLRQRLFQFLTILLIFVIALEAWSAERFSSRVQEGKRTEKSEQTETFEEKVFLLQTKTIVGSLEFFRDQLSRQSINRDLADKLETSIRESFRGSLESVQTAQSPSKSRHEGIEVDARTGLSTALLRKQWIVSFFFGFSDLANKFAGELEKNAGEDELIDDLLFRVRHAGQEPELKGLNFSEHEQRLLIERLGWFGSLLVLKTVAGTAAESAIRKNVYEPASQTFTRFLVALALFVLLSLASVVALGSLLLTFGIGRTKLGFRSTDMPHFYCLEVFCLYLLSMYLLPKILGLIAEGASPRLVLKMNLVGISSLLLLVVWPVFFGQRFTDVRICLGLYLTSLRRVAADLFCAPLCYIASIVPLVLVLTLYSFVLFALDVDAAQGAHPIVPLFTSSNDPQVLLITVILAVFVAPLVEEVMFRGALYAWLRRRLGACASIAASSLVFASIHPQGLIGIIPLTFIGAVLAFVREWRGSILPSAITHAMFNGVTLTLLWVFMA